MSVFTYSVIDCYEVLKDTFKGATWCKDKGSLVVKFVTYWDNWDRAFIVDRYTVGFLSGLYFDAEMFNKDCTLKCFFQAMTDGFINNGYFLENIVSVDDVEKYLIEKGYPADSIPLILKKSGLS